jgi:hypothetical protein
MGYPDHLLIENIDGLHLRVCGNGHLFCFLPDLHLGAEIITIAQGKQGIFPLF